MFLILNYIFLSYQNKDISTLLHEKEVAKTNQYKKVGFNQLSTDFIPLVVDIFGSIGKKDSDYILYLNQFASSSLTNISSLVFHILNTACAIGLAKRISVYNNSLNNSILTWFSHLVSAVSATWITSVKFLFNFI